MQRIRRRMKVQRKEEHHDTEREAGAVLLSQYRDSAMALKKKTMTEKDV